MNQPVTMSHHKGMQRSDAHRVRPGPSRGISLMQARYGVLFFCAQRSLFAPLSAQAPPQCIPLSDLAHIHAPTYTDQTFRIRF